MIALLKIIGEKKAVDRPFMGGFALPMLLAFLFAAGGCRGYKTFTNGFIVRGSDHFVSVDGRFTISIGTDVLNGEIWDRHSPPLRTVRPTPKQKKLLRKLGYDGKNYTVVFTTAKNMPFLLVGLVNTRPVDPEGNTHFPDIGRLDRKTTDYAKWYEERSETGGHRVYHAVIPISEQLFSEKYLCIVYTEPLSQNGLGLIEEMVRMNAEKYRSAGQRYLPMKTVGACQGKKEGYFDYTVPESVRKHNRYTLIKAFADREKTDLVYYSLLQPGQSMGSFKLCAGRYFIEHTYLDGIVLWEEETEID